MDPILLQFDDLASRLSLYDVLALSALLDNPFATAHHVDRHGTKLLSVFGGTSADAGDVGERLRKLVNLELLGSELTVGAELDSEGLGESFYLTTRGLLCLLCALTRGVRDFARESRPFFVYLLFLCNMRMSAADERIQKLKKQDATGSPVGTGSSEEGPFRYFRDLGEYFDSKEEYFHFFRRVARPRSLIAAQILKQRTLLAKVEARKRRLEGEWEQLDARFDDIVKEGLPDDQRRVQAIQKLYTFTHPDLARAMYLKHTEIELKYVITPHLEKLRKDLEYLQELQESLVDD